MRVLIVEDEPELAHLLREALTQRAYVADVAATIEEAKSAAAFAPYAVVVLDRHLPDGDGVGLVQALRASQGKPRVLILTAKNDTADRVYGLEVGADDYLGKPFSIDELVARVRALGRRDHAADAPPICVGRLVYDPNQRSLRIGDAMFTPPGREFAVLEALLLRLGRVVMRETVIAAAYGYDDIVGDNALEAVVSRLRRRLEESGACVQVQAVRGVGYFLTDT